MLLEYIFIRAALTINKEPIVRVTRLSEKRKTVTVFHKTYSCQSKVKHCVYVCACVCVCGCVVYVSIPICVCSVQNNGRTLANFRPNHPFDRAIYLHAGHVSSCLFRSTINQCCQNTCELYTLDLVGWFFQNPQSFLLNLVA